METRTAPDNTAFWTTMGIIAAGTLMLLGWFIGFPW
jgi:hypothetical protein